MSSNNWVLNLSFDGVRNETKLGDHMEEKKVVLQHQGMETTIDN